MPRAQKKEKKQRLNSQKAEKICHLEFCIFVLSPNFSFTSISYLNMRCHVRIQKENNNKKQVDCNSKPFEINTILELKIKY